MTGRLLSPGPDAAATAPPSSPARDMIAELQDKFRDGAHLTVAKSDQLADALHSGQLGSFHASSKYAACLLPLLQALGWRGDIRRLFESLPHFADGLNLTEFRNTLAHLQYMTTPADADMASIDARLLPCLFVEQGRPLVLLSRDERGLLYFDSEDQQEKHADGRKRPGTAYFLSTKYASQTNKTATETASGNWFRDLFLRFKGLLKQLLAMTLLLNVLALLVPLFVMAVYDKVVPSQSANTLGYLVAGICFAVLCEIGLRVLRARQVAYLGARVENITANATFQKLLALPPMMTESAPIGSQVSRLKEFDAIKGLFSGTLVNVILELPFVFLFIAIIAVLAGSLAWIPVVMMGVFALVAAIILPAMKRNVAASTRARAKRHGFLVEALSGLRTLKQTAAEKAWMERYRDLSAESAYTHFRTAQVSLLLQSLAQAIMMGAGIATVGFGVLKVLAGDMTLGALIASMALIWRVLSPLQQLFLTLSRLEQTRNSITQINQLMKIPSEGDPDPNSLSQRRFAGNLVLDRVSFRYKTEAEPALLGVGFRIEAGEMLAIMGPNAAGKSTILKLLLTLHKQQAGQIILDGMDIRQINPALLRQSIAYVPQQPHFFHGTIAQNLRLSQPVASQEDLEEACRMAHVLDEVRGLKNGFETRIGDQSIQSLPSSFKQRLALAQAFLKKAPILLLDEPAKTLDFDGDKALMKTLATLKGHCTILMVSHRPSHIKMADKVLVLQDGMLRNFGPPGSIFPPAGAQAAQAPVPLKTSARDRK